MIRIEDISFGFRASDEAFVRSLYADWDDFCRRCVEPVIDRVLSPYDDGTDIFIEELDLDLGNVPQDDFRPAFMRRLQEELERKFVPPAALSAEEAADRRTERMLSGLTFYLARGISAPDCGEFDLDKTISAVVDTSPKQAAALMQGLWAEDVQAERLICQSDGRALSGLVSVWMESTDIPREQKRKQLLRFAVRHPALLWALLEKLSPESALLREFAALLGPGLLLNPPIALSRSQEELRQKIGKLFPPDATEQPGGDLLAGVLASSSDYERRRCLAALLAADIEGVLCAVRDTQDDAVLRTLAGMLDDAMVWRLIATECQSGADVDMPEYWQELYDSLLDLYPVAGAGFAGDRREFRTQLNFSLLSLIRLRRDAASLSRSELTELFLVGVFGREHYPSVLELLHAPDTSAKTESTDTRAAIRTAADVNLTRTELVLQLAEQSAPAPGLIREKRPADPESLKLEVQDAGLVLLAPWFPRLFSMTGLLNDERTDFKDEPSRRRAIFLLRYLATGTSGPFREPELAFARILTGCPFSVPLPTECELMEEERHTADAMLSGVKANWPKMENTSLAGFRNSFIARQGQIVADDQNNRWLLSVEDRPYDLLLDSLPWSYNPVRLPWLRRMVYVNWRTKSFL